MRNNDGFSLPVPVPLAILRIDFLMNLGSLGKCVTLTGMVMEKTNKPCDLPRCEWLDASLNRPATTAANRTVPKQRMDVDASK
jgi:hypothetical protein